MIRLMMIFAVVCATMLSYASNTATNAPSSLSNPRIEIAELELKQKAARDNGETPDPAWQARIQELLPLVRGHVGNVRVTEPPTAIPLGQQHNGTVAAPTSPLEAQIRELELQLTGGVSSSGLDPVIFTNIKSQLNDLYAQRDVNRPQPNPLDQGTDACPALTMIGVPISFTGTTAGYVNNYNPITPCNTTNAPDVIYQFTPVATNYYEISLQGSSYDTYLYVNTGGACPGNTQVGCNDDYYGLQSRLYLNMNAGQTYYIIVDGYGANSGAYSILLHDLCDVVCQSGDVYECFEYADTVNVFSDCNGACNNVEIELWGSIQPFTWVCGNGFTYRDPWGGDRRDTDFYRFTLTEACSLDIYLESEFPAHIFVTSGGCPVNIYYSSGAIYPCSVGVFTTQSLAPGTYALFVAPLVTTGILGLRNYRVRLDLIPANGCVIDFAMTAPGAHSWNTCGRYDDCGFQPSEEIAYYVNIPYESDWTFSLCNDDSIWDSFMFLSQSCCDGAISWADGGCGGWMLSAIPCQHLSAGGYYLTVDGWSTGNCGPYTLSVTECWGSCCIGEPENPQCIVMSLTDCGLYDGIFTLMEPCSTGACFTRPTCGPNSAVSQPPFVPDEPGTGYPSAVNSLYKYWDYFDADTEIGGVRFWGFASTIGCLDAPREFYVEFLDSVTMTSHSYTSLLTGTPYPPLYWGAFQLMQYDMFIDPPCPIGTGWINIAQLVADECLFYWATSPFGDGQMIQVFDDSPTVVYNNAAFCLTPVCEPVDSTTIQLVDADLYSIRFWVSDLSLVRVWSSADPNAVFPATFTEEASGWVSGSVIYTASYYDSERIFVVTRDCNPALSAPAAPTGIVKTE
ncbi:MAG: hypothetical protein IPG71_04210 [bacterium]|nr:hypothetical protein [bacterium]